MRDSEADWAFAVLEQNTVRFHGAAEDTTVPFPGAGYAHAFSASLAANALATHTEDVYGSDSAQQELTGLNAADRGREYNPSVTYLDKAIETFRYIMSTQWDSGFIPHLSFDADSARLRGAVDAEYVDDVPSSLTWGCPQHTSWLASIPNQASTAVEIFSWATLNNTDAAYTAGIHFLRDIVDDLDRWHNFLATNRSVGWVKGALGGSSLDGLLYIVHPWESVDPYAKIWSDLLPAPKAGCEAQLPDAVRQSPFWGSARAYCQARALMDEMQAASQCNPVPVAPSFAVVDPYFNVAFHDSVASLQRICGYLGSCSDDILARAQAQLEQVSWAKIDAALQRPLSSSTGLLGPYLSWYQAQVVTAGGGSSKIPPEVDYRASDATVLLAYNNADNAKNITRSSAASTGTFAVNQDAVASASADGSGAQRVCTQLLAAPVQTAYPAGTVASFDTSGSFVTTPSLNVVVARALRLQNFSGAAFTVKETTIAVLDYHVANLNKNAASMRLPYAYRSDNYSWCAGNNGSCSGPYSTSVASASAYILLSTGDAPTPQVMANIGLLGTEIFIGIELFVMVVIAVGFLTIAVQLLRQVRTLEDYNSNKITLFGADDDDEVGPLLGRLSHEDADTDDDEDNVIHDDALASDFLQTSSIEAPQSQEAITTAPANSRP